MDKEALNEIYARLNRELSTITAGSLGNPVHWVYNPLDYAWAMHEAYIRTYAPQETGGILFMGMNPGPDGMAQTGIPFGAVSFVRDYLGLDEPITTPSDVHPKKPVKGLQWHRDEPSGKRLWGFIQEIAPDPADFFSRNFLINHCPLLFLGESGANIATATLNHAQLQLFLESCDRAVGEIIALLQPRALVGIGVFAAKAFSRILEHLPELEQDIPVHQILHPSPASPAANRDWKGQVQKSLESSGLWPLV